MILEQGKSYRSRSGRRYIIAMQNHSGESQGVDLTGHHLWFMPDGRACYYDNRRWIPCKRKTDNDLVSEWDEARDVEADVSLKVESGKHYISRDGQRFVILVDTRERNKFGVSLSGAHVLFSENGKAHQYKSSKGYELVHEPHPYDLIGEWDDHEEAFRRKQDALTEFLQLCPILDPGYDTFARKVNDAFSTWYDRNYPNPYAKLRGITE